MAEIVDTVRERERERERESYNLVKGVTLIKEA